MFVAATELDERSDGHDKSGYGNYRALDQGGRRQLGRDVDHSGQFTADIAL